MKEIIVFGGDHHNLLGVIRSLGKKGITPFVLLHDASLRSTYKILKSKYVGAYKVVPDCETGIKYLLEEYYVTGEKPVIICTSDDASSFVDRNYDSLSCRYSIPNCGEKGKITQLMDKENMRKEAVKAGFCVPEDIVVDKSTSLFNIPFPCIAKPLLSIGGTKDDIAVSKSIEELKQHLKNSRCLKFQVQEYIDKEFEYQLIGCSLNGGNIVVIPGRSRIISQPTCTNTGFLRFENFDGSEPLKESQTFLKNICYSGLFSLEFLRGKDGRDYFMEINLRNDGNSICVTEAGVNLPYVWYAYNTGLAWEKEVPAKIKGLYAMPEYTELELWMEGIISSKRLKDEMKMADVFMDYSKDDPAPTNGHSDAILFFLRCLVKKPIKMILTIFSNND